MSDVRSGPRARGRKIPPERLDEVERRLLRVDSTRDIERECSVAWGTTRRNIRRYIALARKRIAARAAAVTPEQYSAQVVTMIEDAYRTARDEHDPKAMVAAARTLAEVTGVAAPRKVDLTSGGAPLKLYLPDEDA